MVKNIIVLCKNIIKTHEKSLLENLKIVIEFIQMIKKSLSKMVKNVIVLCKNIIKTHDKSLLHCKNNAMST